MLHKGITLPVVNYLNPGNAFKYQATQLTFTIFLNMNIEKNQDVASFSLYFFCLVFVFASQFPDN